MLERKVNVINLDGMIKVHPREPLETSPGDPSRDILFDCGAANVVSPFGKNLFDRNSY